MAYGFTELTTLARDWARTAIELQQMKADQAEELFSLDQRTPDNLFIQADSRPLIIAFMGGTGVGKSSLLNRLAEQDIARTGVERPTSREVTLYHHVDININQMPNDLPLESVRLGQHHDDSKKNIIWIDMPDMDSVELANKQLVFEWLPHIDILLYVVSPERYRDNKAWQLLMSESARHAWVFVFNQWDRAQPSQLDDFRQQLAKAGFDDPVVFKSDCTGQSQDDEFNLLVNHLLQLASGNQVRVLEQHGREVRLRELQAVLSSIHAQLAKQDYAALTEYFQKQWQYTVKLLTDGFNWPLQQMALGYAKNPAARVDNIIWDEWAQTRFNDMIDQVIAQAAELELPAKKIKLAFEPVRVDFEKTLLAKSELYCRNALLRPGSRFRRSMLVLLRISELVLPLLAMGVVGFEVFSEYYQGITEDDQYLGTDFAIHSVLLIALSWLIPFFLHKKMQPSLYKAADKGLKEGIAATFARFETEMTDILNQQQQVANDCLLQLEGLISECDIALQQSPNMEIDQQLGRMLAATPKSPLQ